MSSIIRATTTSGLQVAPDNSGSIQLQTNGTTAAVTIDTSQNVGIGTTSPSCKLVVDVASDGTDAIQVQSTSSNGTIRLRPDGTNGNVIRWGGNGTNAATLRFLASGDAERMRIDANGNVGIGTDSPTQKLDVATATGNIYTSIRTGDTSNAGVYLENSSRGFFLLSAGGAFTVYDGTAGADRLRVEAAGTLTSQPTYNNTASGSTVIVTSAGLIRRTSSSLKYKKDVETLEQTIVDNAVNNLRPVWYRTKNAEGDDKATWSHIGLIAEEVDLVEPRLVKYKTAEVTQDENGANVTTELETPVPEDVDYAKLSVILLAKVKQLEARIAVLEAK